MVSDGARRLLVCTPSHSIRGGGERILEALCRGLPERGFEVIVGLAWGARFNLPQRFVEEYPAVRWVPIDGRSGTREGRLRGVRRVLRDVRPDIVLNARLFDVYRAVAERKLLGEPLRLATAVLAYEPEYVADVRLFHEFVDLCVTNGERLARAMELFGGLPSGRVVNIPGGVAPPRRRVSSRPPGQPLRIGYVGRLEESQRRVLDLPATLSALRERNVPFSCRIAGTGSAEQALREEVSRRGLAPAVHFEGWLSTEELYERLYPSLDVLVSFSDFEGVPIAPREAMAHGVVPVIGDYLGCSAEGLFRHGENCLLFPPGDVDEAADRLVSLHTDGGLLSRLSEAAARPPDGVYSAEGALGAWTEALTGALAAEPAVGSSLPEPGGGGRSRLDGVLGRRAAETLRSVVGRRYLHADAGSEWPHWSGRARPGLLEEIAAFGREARWTDQGSATVAPFARK